MDEQLKTETTLDRRLIALAASRLLDSPPERRFDRLTKLLAGALRVPIALVALVDADRQFFKSATGLPSPYRERRETPLSHSFCRHVVETEAPLIVHNARETPLVANNPAIQDLGVEAYLGVPITDRHGTILGSLCAIDHVPHRWTEEDLALLLDVCALVQREIADVKSAEELTQTEFLSRTLLNAMPQIVWLTDANGNPAGFNDRWFRVTGMAAESHDTWLDYVHPEDRAAAVAEWRSCLATEQPFETSFRIRHQTGDYHATFVHGVPLRAEQGGVERCMCSGTDIQSLKTAETANAKARESLIEGVIAALTDAAAYAPKAEYQAMRRGITELRKLVPAGHAAARS